MSPNPEMMNILYPRPEWDPAPEWIRIDPEMFQQFAKMEIEFKIKELELKQQKLEAMGKMMRG